MKCWSSFVRATQRAIDVGLGCADTYALCFCASVPCFGSGLRSWAWTIVRDVVLVPPGERQTQKGGSSPAPRSARSEQACREPLAEADVFVCDYCYTAVATGCSRVSHSADSINHPTAHSCIYDWWYQGTAAHVMMHGAGWSAARL